MVKKVCKKGWGCGSTCISMTKKCRSNLDENGQTMVENFAQYIARLRPEGGAAGAIRRGDLEDPTKMTQAQRLLELAKDRPEGGAAGAIRMLEEVKRRENPIEEDVDKFLNTPDEELADSDDLEEALAELESWDAAQEAPDLRSEAAELIKQAFRFEDEQQGALEVLNGLDDETLEAAVAELRSRVNGEPLDGEEDEEDDFVPSQPKTVSQEEIDKLKEPIDASQRQSWAEGALSSIGRELTPELEEEGFEREDFNPDDLSDNDPAVRAEHVKQLKGNIDEDRAVLAGMGLDADNFVAAITDFSRGGYSDMRAIDRGVDDNSEFKVGLRESKGYDAKNQVINQFLDRAEPFNGDLYRGVNTNGDKAANAFYDSMNSLEPGDEFEQQSYSSFSSSKGVADEFASGFRDPIVFKIPKGKNTRGASIAAYSDQPDESEVLTKKGKYKVTNVIIDKDGKKIIELEEA